MEKPVLRVSIPPVRYSSRVSSRLSQNSMSSPVKQNGDNRLSQQSQKSDRTSSRLSHNSKQINDIKKAISSMDALLLELNSDLVNNS
jgi:hypothetical protein